MTKSTLFFLLTLFVTAVTAPAQSSDWVVESNPYRVQLTLDRAIDSKAMLAVDPDKLVEHVAQVAIDQVDAEMLAFERTVLVNPDTGNIVGRFQLVRVGRPFDIDGSFQNIKKTGAPWYGFNPEKMTLKPVKLGGKTHQALLIKEEKITNVKLSQTIQVEAGKHYLLEYWVLMEPIDNEINVMISDPSHRLFSHVPHSYYNKMPPFGEWAERSVLFRARTHGPEGRPLGSVNSRSLEVTHAFIGRAAVAGLKLQEVAWRLVVEPDQPTDKLDLYTLARAGHRLTASPDEYLITSPPRNLAMAEMQKAELQNLNPRGIKVEGDGVVAWTVNPTLPLKVGLLESYQSRNEAPEAAEISVYHGSSASLVVAVDSGTSRLDDLVATSDLPVDVVFHRLATIPVYDGPTVNGQVIGNHIETRYEAMVPTDYALDPDSEDGLHVVVATITPREDTPNGAHVGQVDLRFAGKALTVPVELRVSPLCIQPKQHFATLVGSNTFFRRAYKGVADMAEDGPSTVEYHGLAHDDPQMRQKIKPIIDKYHHVMLDNHLAPQSPALTAMRPIHYKVIDQGPGRAPKLTDWDFSGGFDDAVREFVLARDMPWFLIGHSNGHLMHYITLCDGKSYSYKPNADNPNWVQLPRDEFYQLVGDYWNAMAKHMDELGVLDRLVFTVDESQEFTYDDIHDYVMAFKERDYSSHIKVGHTIQKPSAWTRRLSNGELMMKAVLDIPMPGNDEHYNFFEHEWNERITRPDTIQWVYQVETDHVNILHGGLSSAFLPLRLQNLGVKGWWIWGIFDWSLPYAHLEGTYGGPKYKTGPVGNPWVNPFYHHGPGVLSHFYPPDPRGLASEPNELVIPSFRLTLMRDGIQEHALLEVLRAGRDDAGHVFDVDVERLTEAETRLKKLWPDNSVQWYLGYGDYYAAQQMLFDLAMESEPREDH